MNLIQEADEIIANAKAKLLRREITPQQFCDATRIPMKDAFLTIFDSGGQYLALRSDIHVPAFAEGEVEQ